MKTKHVGKACGDLWGKSTVLKVVFANYSQLRRGRGVKKSLKGNPKGLVITSPQVHKEHTYEVHISNKDEKMLM